MTINKSITPAGNLVEVTPSDTEELEDIRGIIIASTGDISFLNSDGTTQLVPSGGLAIGMIHPFFPKRINATGTTVTKIYKVY